jgi:hypothetical protein
MKSWFGNGPAFSFLFDKLFGIYMLEKRIENRPFTIKASTFLKNVVK